VVTLRDVAKIAGISVSIASRTLSDDPTRQVAIENLAPLGHRRLAFVGPAPAVDERAEAFIYALARLDLPLDPALVIQSPWTAECAYPVARELFTRGVVPDALVGACDMIAMGAAKKCDLRLPDDLAITGFDYISFARYLNPPLTTVHVPKELLGELAVRKVDRAHKSSRASTCHPIGPDDPGGTGMVWGKEPADHAGVCSREGDS